MGRSLTEAKALAREAIAEGADAIMGHHPMDPFAGPSYQAKYFLELADASTVPVIAYVRSDTFSVADFRKLALHENIAGIKFASGNLMLLARCNPLDQGYAGDLGLRLWPRAGRRPSTQWALVALPLGSSTSSRSAPIPFTHALEAGDYQQAARASSTISPVSKRMRTKYLNGANVTVVKEALGMLGTDVGPVRVPGVESLERKRAFEPARDRRTCRTRKPQRPEGVASCISPALKTYMQRVDDRPRLLLKIETSEGISGWGECYNHGPDWALPPLLDYLFHQIEGKTHAAWSSWS